MTFLFDTFTGADGTLITSRSPNVGPSWAHWSFGSSNATTGVILGNAAGNNGSADSGGNTRLISASDAPSTDYALTGTIKVIGATRSTGLMVRCQSGAYTGYLAFIADTGVLTLYRINDGSLTSLGTWDFTWSAGESHEVSLAAVGSGASIALSVKVDGVQRISVSDTSADRITSAGRPGLWLSGGTQYRVDSLSAVDIAAAAITVTPPSDLRVYQRASAQATVSLSGTYTGTPSAIQARVVLDGTSTEVVGWTTIDAAPVGSTYSGAIVVPEGGWYNVEVRQSPSTELTATSSNKFGVGALYCIAGQSNAMQWLTIGTGTPTGATAKYAGSGAWAANTGSGGIAFANAMASALGVPVGLIGIAADGAALTSAGDRGSGYWLNTSGAPWATWLSAMADVGGKLEGLLWLQGESDALQGVSGTAYSTGLTTLFAAMRSQLGQASLPIFMAPLCRSSHADSTDAEWNAINDAFTNYSAANVTLACDTWDLPQADSLHYSATGYATLAERFALAVRASKGESVYSRGPAITGGARNATTADIVVSHAGGTDVAPASGVTGFRFVDNGTPVSPTSVVRLNATTFRATFGSDLVGPLYVSVAWGQQPSVTDSARDSTGLPVRRTLSAGVFLSGAKLELAVYPSETTPTFEAGVWAPTPVYTDSEIAPTDTTPHVFTPDVSGLSAGTAYRVWLAWVDGETTVGTTASNEWTTSAAAQNLAASGAAIASGSAALDAQIALDGVGVSLASGSATLAASGPLAASGTSTASGTAAPKVDIALSALGLTVSSGTAALSSSTSGSLAATGSATAGGSAAAVANVSISASGLAQAAAQAGLAASVLLSGAGAAAAAGNAALAVQLQALAQGAAQASGTAALQGSTAGQLSAGGQATASGSAALVLDVRLQAAGGAQAGGSGALSAGDAATISGSGGATSGGSGALSALVTLTGAGFVQAMGAGYLVVQVPLSATGGAIAAGGASLSELPDMLPRVASPYRTWRVRTHNRTLRIRA